jgi:hypothetical protein
MSGGGSSSGSAPKPTSSTSLPITTRTTTSTAASTGTLLGSLASLFGLVKATGSTTSANGVKALSSPANGASNSTVRTAAARNASVGASTSNALTSLGLAKQTRDKNGNVTTTLTTTGKLAVAGGLVLGSYAVYRAFRK